MKRLVVVGGGYGGTEVIRQLIMRGVRNIEVELICNKTSFENTIGGAELISEKTNLQELTYGLKELANYWNFELTIGSMDNVDLNEKRLKVGNKERNYDILVLALGSEPNFYHVKGANIAQPAYHLTDFIDINKKLRSSLDNPDIVVAGGGFVGLEVSAEMLDLFKAMDKKNKLIVVEKMTSVLPAYNNDSAKKIAMEHFTSLGVKFLLGNGIKEVGEEKLILEDGGEIDTDLTIWTAGVKGCVISSQITGANVHIGCIDVDERLLIKGSEDAFAIGDASYAIIGGKEAMKMAAEALLQAKTTSKNIALIAEGRRPGISHVPEYIVDYPKALLSMGQGKAMIIFGPNYVSVGASEYILKKRIDFQEIMERFPQ